MTKRNDDVELVVSYQGDVLQVKVVFKGQVIYEGPELEPAEMQALLDKHCGNSGT